VAGRRADIVLVDAAGEQLEGVLDSLAASKLLPKGHRGSFRSYGAQIVGRKRCERASALCCQAIYHQTNSCRLRSRFGGTDWSCIPWNRRHVSGGTAGIASTCQNSRATYASRKRSASNAREWLANKQIAAKLAISETHRQISRGVDSRQARRGGRTEAVSPAFVGPRSSMTVEECFFDEIPELAERWP